MKLRHIVESQQFTVPVLMELFQRSRLMEKIVARGGTKDYDSKIMATVFYAPSTRTRFSFETAMYRLGGHVLSTEQAQEFSSTIEGERLEDTIRIIANFADVIVLRPPEAGGAKRASEYSRVPIINAGDGDGGQHPTQALLDLYTIYKERKSLDGLKVAFIGALDHGRTVRSLAYLLSKFDRVKLHFIAPREMQMRDDILRHLDENDVWYSLDENPTSVIAEADVVYQTRIDRERLTGSSIDLRTFNLDGTVLSQMKPNAIIMHPLPRSVEIAPEVDSDPRAKYFQQTENGLFVRMALLTMVFDTDTD